MDHLRDPLLDPTKVARLLGLEVETLGAWRRRGYGPRWYRIGKKIRYAGSDLRDWMNGQVGPTRNHNPEGTRTIRSQTHPGWDEGGEARRDK